VSGIKSENAGSLRVVLLLRLCSCVEEVRHFENYNLMEKVDGQHINFDVGNVFIAKFDTCKILLKKFDSYSIIVFKDVGNFFRHQAEELVLRHPIQVSVELLRQLFFTVYVYTS
jgi:hypothetical protein